MFCWYINSKQIKQFPAITFLQSHISNNITPVENHNSYELPMHTNNNVHTQSIVQDINKGMEIDDKIYETLMKNVDCESTAIFQHILANVFEIFHNDNIIIDDEINDIDLTMHEC